MQYFEYLPSQSLDDISDESFDKIVGSALEIIEDFLTTEPSLEERHQRRVNKIINYEFSKQLERFFGNRHGRRL